MREKSKQDHALAVDFDAAAATAAGNRIIDPNHVVSGLLKSGIVVGIGSRRKTGFLGPADPADLIFGRSFTHWTL